MRAFSRRPIPLLPLALQLVWLVAAPASSGKDARYRREVIIPSYDGLVRGEECVHYWGRMASSDFFEGLRRTGPPGNPVFHKGPRVLNVFPERVWISVLVAVEDCNGDPLDFGPPPQGSDLRHLQFDAERDTSLHLMPLATSAMVVDEAQDRSGRSVLRYQFSVATKDVPLADALIIFVLSPEGKRVGQLSVRL